MRRTLAVSVLALALLAAVLPTRPATAQTTSPIPFDLRTWVPQGLSGDWDVSADGLEVTQVANDDPGFFVSPGEVIDTTISGRFAVETSTDDDYVGFVLGYAGPTQADQTTHDYVLLSWKQADQSGFGGCEAKAGFTLSRVNGTVPLDAAAQDDFRLDTHWCQEQIVDDPRYEVLATAWDPAAGWEDLREYDFEITYTASRVTLVLDGVQVLDVPGSFPAGSFGFYNYSQPQARYMGFAQTAQQPVDPTPAAPERPGDPGTFRLDGTAAGDAIDVSIQVCQELVGDGQAGQISLARVDDFADALSATQLRRANCILFTDGGADGTLDPRTRAELARAFGTSGGLVNLMGGPAALSPSVEATLAGDGYDLRRFAGPTRFETAEAVAQQAIADEGRDAVREIVIAYGLNWPDAVTAGAWVNARPGALLVLSDTTSLHPAAARIVASTDSISQVLAGGEGVLGPQVSSALPSPRRLAGLNRMDTAALIAENLWPQIPATGEDFVFVNLDRADAWTLALAAAPLSAAIEGPQLGVRTDSIPTETTAYLEDQTLAEVPARVVLGDLSFISDDVVRGIELITGN